MTEKDMNEELKYHLHVCAYDGDKYRTAEGKVRDRINTLHNLDLSDENQLKARAIAQKAARTAINLGQELGNLTEDMSDNELIGLALQDLFIAFFQASEVAYNGPRTERDIDVIRLIGNGGSESDLKTDRAGLHELPEII